MFKVCLRELFAVNCKDHGGSFAETAAFILETEFNDGFARGQRIFRGDRRDLLAKVVVCIRRTSIFYIEAITRSAASFSDENSISTASGDVDVSCEGVCAIACAGSERVVELRGAWVEGVEASAAGWRRVEVLASCDARVYRINFVLPGFAIKERFELIATQPSL